MWKYKVIGQSSHPTTGPISLIKKASGFFSYYCSITFSETIIILQDNYFPWANFLTLLVQRNLRVESKQNFVYLFHTSGTRVNSVQNTLGERGGGRGKGKIKKAF